MPSFENIPSSTPVDAVSALSPEFTPTEAARAEPELTAKAKQQAAAVEVATRAADECKKLCDEDAIHKTFLADRMTQARGDRTKLLDKLRPEHFALRHDFSLEHIQTLRTLSDVAEYWRAELEHHVSVKSGLDGLQHLDALEAQRACEFDLACTVALLSHVRTVARLEAAYVEEGGVPGSLGILGRRTIELRQAADTAGYRWKLAQDAARDARARYEKQQSALMNQGIITSGNVRNAIPKL